MNNTHTDDADVTFKCSNDLDMEKKKDLLLTLKKENKQLNEKLSILNKAIDVLKNNDFREKKD